MLGLQVTERVKLLVQAKGFIGQGESDKVLLVADGLRSLLHGGVIVYTGYTALGFYMSWV